MGSRERVLGRKLLTPTSPPDSCPELEAALGEAPADWGLRLVYADWLQERGHEDLAAFMRLLAASRVAPACWARDPWPETPWVLMAYRWYGCPSHAIVVGAVFGHLMVAKQKHPSETREGHLRGGTISWYRTRRRAEADLLRAWAAAGRPARIGENNS